MPLSRKELELRLLPALTGWGALLFSTLLPGLSQAQITATVSGRILDQQGLGLPGATVEIKSEETGLDRSTQADSAGFYSVPGLMAGDYRMVVWKRGFGTKAVPGITVTINSNLTLDVSLELAQVRSTVDVQELPPLLETQTSSSGRVITPLDIDNMPLNGRNYLDLLQLVPGVALNRQADPGSDTATPILGERSGNTQFLIDGLSNSDEVNGGAASPFNQDSILEFQVITSGYKAEFGDGSGGIVNVVSKSGTNDFHGSVSMFHRNYKLDSSNIAGQASAPFLLRWDPSGQFGGPLVKDRAFFFVSAERILESRNLNFQFPPSEPAALVAFESPFNQNSKTFDTRLRARLDEQLGRHRLTEEMNLTNTHVTDFLPLSEAVNLPSTRTNSDARHLMIGVSDSALLGKTGNPLVLEIHSQYRGEPFRLSPAHPQAGAAATVFNMFDNDNSGQVTGDLGQVVFGPGFTPFTLDQEYAAAGISLARASGRHSWKTGLDFLRTMANGTEANNISNQLFATISDFNQFGPLDSGIDFIRYEGGAMPQDDHIHLRDNYLGLYGQDDWKLLPSLTINYGLRWDYDSGFPNRLNFSPRIGVAWSLNSKTVVRAGWGIFYDHYRLGTARDVLALGGADITRTQYMSFPRLFYGDPSEVTQVFGISGTGVPCISNTLTDSQVAQQNPSCMLAGNAVPLPVYGIDHLNSVVASGHTPIPANAVVDISNIQQLSGLSPQQFAKAASAAIGRSPGFFTWDPFGHLSTTATGMAGNPVPVTIDPSYTTPYTSGMQVALERELTRDSVIEADYYHRDMYNILGVRNTNLAFIARIPGHTGQLQPGTGNNLTLGYGPWYAGTYDGATISLRKRLGSRLTVDVAYTFAHATDDAVANLTTNEQVGYGLSSASGLDGPVDSFVGIPPVVTDPRSGKTNANGPFIASNGNPVPQAGKFYNGPALTSGPSDLALDHTFLLDEVWQFGWGFSLSGIFRAQSGFHYSAATLTPADVDGDGYLNGLDYTKGRNHFTAPPFVNLDVRLAKFFAVGENVRLHAYVEFFNLFNRANPAAVEQFPNVSSAPFGATLQVLPGREGQVGVRLDF
jgi:Carboxypeptidase regulatory-like domain/TonB dependent receptor/TonB-dependent Receptor Plug Domain